jgi:hypothetical protein
MYVLLRSDASLGLPLTWEVNLHMQGGLDSSQAKKLKRWTEELLSARSRTMDQVCMPP